MTFYQSVFVGELAGCSFADFQASEHPAEQDKTMHSMLSTEHGLVLMAADTPNSMEYTRGNNFSLPLPLAQGGGRCREYRKTACGGGKLDSVGFPGLRPNGASPSLTLLSVQRGEGRRSVPVGPQQGVKTVTRSGQDSLGVRLRRLRLARGLSQQQLADGELSPSYVSLVEAGKRVPTQAVLDHLAQRLGCDVAFLVEGVAQVEAEQQELELRYAELALHSGEATEALSRFEALARDDASPAATPSVRSRARWGVARALEATGALESAIAVYERVREQAEAEPEQSPWLPAVIALCRCYREAGDLGRAVDLGERARARLRELRLGGADEEVELLSTLAGCHQERGDLIRARLMIDEALEYAEHRASRRSLGAVYWNASLLAAEAGRFGEALSLAERALALYAEGEDQRSLARLRNAYAWLLLRQDPPAATRAEQLLTAARQTLVDVGSDIDLAHCDTELARARLVQGDPHGAVEAAERSLRELGTEQRLEAARARLVLGQALLGSGDQDGALFAYLRASEDLRSIGASRQAAAAWRELAEVFVQMGRDMDALAAYRQAADASGVPAPAGVAVPAAAPQATRQGITRR